MRSDEVVPSPTPVKPLLAMSCAELRSAIDGLEAQVADAADAVDARRGGNFIALSLGVTVFWPALAAIRSNEPQAAALASLKGEQQALEQAMSQKDCADNVPTLKLPDDGVWRGLPQAGDRYVFEEIEPISGTVTGRNEWRLQSARTDRFEYSFRSGAADEARVVTDAAGNWRSGHAPGLRFLQFLRADIVPGQQLRGQVATAELADGIGRLDGRVAALLRHELDGRQFEAARIELHGYAPLSGEQSPLVAAGNELIEGWVIVERRTGQVLQAEVHCSNPAFSWRRRLVRFERG